MDEYERIRGVRSGCEVVHRSVAVLSRTLAPRAHGCGTTRADDSGSRNADRMFPSHLS